jgi:tetratricopeptide (TPR) repeat protein
MQEPGSYILDKRAKSAEQKSVSASQTMVTDILVRAGRLARRGNLLEAENLLKTLPDADSTRIEVVDLLAKVYAQQGKIDKAQAMWLEALQRDPSNTHFLSALRLCAFYSKSRFEQFVSRYLWLLLVVVLWFLIAMAVILSTAL